MAGTLKRISGPAFLSASAADIYTPPASTIFTTIKHIHLANVTASGVTHTLYVGATGGSAAGTELYKGETIPANSSVDKFFSPGLKMLSTDFLSGLAGSGSAITITVMGEQTVV